MNATIEILRGELERLFSLEEMTTMSHRLLGLDPEQVGGATAKATFARALTERCVDGDQLEALVDVILASKPAVDPRVRDIAALLGKEELSVGQKIGPFTIVRRLGESELSYVYLARRDGDAFSVQDCVLKVLRRDVVRDRRAVQRFLTANRLVASIQHEGLPKNLTAGELEPGLYYVAYDHVDAQPLSVRFARTGPSHINELRPILRGILEPLAALHKAHLVHGDLKMENILVGRAQDGTPRITLIDFGADRLRQRPMAANGHTGVLAVFGSPRTVAPEIVRGRPADAASDVYAFGAIVYELLCGKPVFAAETATDAAFAHLMKDPEPPSAKAPRGWVTKELDEFVLSLLNKDAARRPRDAAALLDAVEALGRSTAARAAGAEFPEERLTELVDALIAAPDNTEAAIALEKAVDEGADPLKVAEAFDVAADGLENDGASREIKKALLYRAARIFDTQAKDKALAEKVYKELVELDPEDEIAQIALEEIRKQLGKYDEVVEMLVARSEAAPAGEERARIFAEIGRLLANELDDVDQGLVAMTRALCEQPTNEEYAQEIERLAGTNTQQWGEVLASMTEAIKGDLPQTERNALLAHAGRWYDQKASRADMALMAYQQILTTDPANEVANEGLSVIYRRAQQWPELAAILLARADAAGSSPRGRELRAEAAEIFESKLNDVGRAKEIYAGVLAEDPGHAKAGEALIAIAERTGDFQTLVGLLERRAEAKRGEERVEVLTRVAEVYEDHLNDLGEATRRYEAVLALDPTNLVALKGLDRIFNRTGKYRELLENLERQVQLAATPRQKINLYERMASLHDEEFLDHAAAAQALEAVLALDPQNDHALTALARHYRSLGKWEDLVRLYETHANVTTDDARRIELLIARARVLAEQIGSPERAMRAYEAVLERAPGHAGSLEELARLRELSGDADAALAAIETLAAKATTPEQKAEQWIRAARLLEGRGDKDGAIERYKLALEANPKDPTASAALRQAYTQRGDIQGIVNIIEQDLVHADGTIAKARLYAELARVYRERLRDNGKAEVAAREAVGFDPTNADALIVLGDLAYEEQRWLEATKHYETLIGRAATFPRADAVRVLVRFIEACGRSTPPRVSSPSLPPSTRDLSIATGRPSTTTLNPRLAGAVEALKALGPMEPDVLVRVARVVFDQGDAAMAREMYSDLLSDHGEGLSLTERAEALYRLGESARRIGDLDAAVGPLQEAASADPGNPAPLQALAKVYEERGDWESVIRTKRRRLEVAAGAERFELLLEIGDVEFQKLGDRARAAKSYVTALEERPDDRKLLTKLMQVYSEDKDWGKLVDVVLRLAEFVEEPRQRAKYMHTAAIVSARQMNAIDRALGFYDKALEYDPTLSKALEEAIELRRARGHHEDLERLLKMQLEQAKQAQDRDTVVSVLDQLGELYRKFLNEPDLAVDAYEAAQAFDPENKERSEILAELYASDVKQYLDKAVRAQAQLLRRNPYRVESYKLLRKLYTEGRRADASWCMCQTLSVLNLAEPDEERFYNRHRADNAAPAQTSLEDADWDKLLGHHDLDPLVTRIFALIQPTMLRMRTQPLEAHGYDVRYALDPALHPYPVSQTLHYVQGVLGFGPPLIFQNANDPGGLGFLHAHTPALIIGRAALEAQVPNQSAAFVAARHVTYFRPGYYARQLVPNPTSLKAWLFAAIKLCVPQFPVAPDMQGEIAEAMAGLQEDFHGALKEKLGGIVARLIQSGGAVDLKKWVAAVDYTADRAGFLLAHDLAVATEAMRATEEAASVPIKERMKEVVLFSASEEYIWLRQKLGITIED